MADEEDYVSRVYTIPLRNVKRYPRLRRAPRAVREIKMFVTRHMKPEDDDQNPITDWQEACKQKKLYIGEDVNRKIWERGIENPPSSIRVSVLKDKSDGAVDVDLAE